MRAIWIIPVIVSILILGTLGLSQNAYAPPFNEDAKLTASDAAFGDRFGESVSISGDIAIVSAPRNNDPAIESGSAYVFDRNEGGAGNWGQVAKLTPSDPTAGDQFGTSVSISGDTAIVSALNDDDKGPNSGSAYVFVKPGGGWTDSTQTAKLTASDGAGGDNFGLSVSISGDTVIVGARLDDDACLPTINTGCNSGSAYVFVKPGGGWTGSLNEDAKLTASDGAVGDNFGASVSISVDTAIVGAFVDDNLKGSAYVFVKPGGGWTGSLNEDAKLTASDAAFGDRFGSTVSISGDTAIVGAHNDGADSGSAYVFVKPGGGWTGPLNEDAKLTASDAAGIDLFGVSVSISVDTAIVGAFFDDDACLPTINTSCNSGSAYVFVKPGGGWTGPLNEDAKLTASDAAADDNFGISVSISGGTAIVGAFFDDDTAADSGSAYVFELTKADLSITKTDNQDPVIMGNELIYTLTVDNAGPGDPQNVVVSDTLPAGVTLVSVSSSQGGCAALPCNLGTITNGGSATVTITVMVNFGTLDILTNTASVSGTIDPDTTNNEDTAETLVEAGAPTPPGPPDEPGPPPGVPPGVPPGPP